MSDWWPTYDCEVGTKTYHVERCLKEATPWSRLIEWVISLWPWEWSVVEEYMATDIWKNERGIVVDTKSRFVEVRCQRGLASKSDAEREAKFKQQTAQKDYAAKKVEAAKAQKASNGRKGRARKERQS